MKKITALLVSLSLTLLLTGCGSSGPSAAAEEFFQAISQSDLDRARELVVPEQREIIGMFAMIPAEDLEEIGQARAIREEIDGDRAVVTVQFGDDEEEETVDMVLRDNEWLVDLGDMK